MDPTPGRRTTPDLGSARPGRWTHLAAMTSPPNRVETVPVRRMGRGPVALAALAMTLVAVSIVKPWAGADPGAAEQSRDLSSPAAVAVKAALDAPTAAAPVNASPAPPRPDTVARIAAVGSAPLAPGQVECGTSGWELVTLGSFLRWTVRTLTAITPVEAAGPGDPAIQVLALGESDVAGVGACAPAISPAAPGRASRIMGAWRRSSTGATASGPAATAPTGPSGAKAVATDGRSGTTGTWEPLTLAQLDPLPPDVPAATRPAPANVTELVRPVPAAQRGRWPAGRYVLLLASPDAGGDRWIAIDLGGGR